MSTATDQLVLRKHMPKKMMMKAPPKLSLARKIPATRKGMLMRRLAPQITGSIHSYLGLRFFESNIPAVTPINPENLNVHVSIISKTALPPNNVTAPKYMVTSSLVIGPHIP